MLWRANSPPQSVCKQKRNTKGYLKLKRSVDMTSSGINGLNIRPKKKNKCVYGHMLKKIRVGRKYFFFKFYSL